jgi:asparagine synthase (glutamine-hydrolysing)
VCGIAGIVRWDGAPVLEQEIRGMCGAIVHRGPDEEGVYIGDGVAIGMRRLSIIDLEGGHQPISNEDGTIWIVFNGEIYNYRELRRDLERDGHTFKTDSDTETIVHLYEDLGPRCVERLRGMFGFAIWDERKRQVLIARDRLGIKPMYFAERNGELVFSSELKPILTLGHIPRAIDWGAANHLFTFLSTPSDRSIVDGVQKLAPASVAIATPGRPLQISKYWDVAFQPNEEATEAELVEQLRALLVESVTLHQVSDVPVGAFLSGGLDSSAVVALMAKPAAGRLKTFSIGFAESSFNELQYARDVARQFGTEHHDLVLRPDVVGIVEDLTWYLDEPFGDTSAIPTYMVSKLASEHVKVVLSGDGGDELFAGYDKYVVEDRERQRDRIPRPLRAMAGTLGRAMPEGMTGRRFLRHLALDGPRRYLDASTMFGAADLRKLFRPDAFRRLAQHDPLAESLAALQRGGQPEQRAGVPGDRDWLASLQYHDLHTYLPLDILTKVDRATMAHSLEARPPLLDHRLVEFAATVPARFRMRNGTTKYLFKQAMRGILPDRIIDRQKQGFAVPLATWFRGDLAGFARDLLLSARCRERGFFDTRYIERLLALNERGRNLDLQLWTVMSFELWCQRFLDSSPRPQPAPIRETRRVAPAIIRAAQTV